MRKGHRKEILSVSNYPADGDQPLALGEGVDAADLLGGGGDGLEGGELGHALGELGGVLAEVGLAHLLDQAHVVDGGGLGLDLGTGQLDHDLGILGLLLSGHCKTKIVLRFELQNGRILCTYRGSRRG